MGLGHLRSLGALRRLESAAEIIEEVGLCRNMYLHPYEKTVSATGALLKAFDVNDKFIAAWDGNIAELDLSDMQFALFTELHSLMEAMVESDLETWSDGASASEIARTYRQLARVIEFSR